MFSYLTVLVRENESVVPQTVNTSPGVLKRNVTKCRRILLWEVSDIILKMRKKHTMKSLKYLISVS